MVIDKGRILFWGNIFLCRSVPWGRGGGHVIVRSTRSYRDILFSILKRYFGRRDVGTYKSGNTPSDGSFQPLEGEKGLLFPSLGFLRGALGEKSGENLGKQNVLR